MKKTLKKSDEEKCTTNCWEFLDCPEEIHKQCPAYPKFGRECWRFTGTKCAGGKYEMATLDEKLFYCWHECRFYKTFIDK